MPEVSLQISVLFFGPLAEIAGSQEVKMDHFADTNLLSHQLHLAYPPLAKAHYVMAVDQQIVTENTPLNPGSEVALLPPFSGG